MSPGPAEALARRALELGALGTWPADPRHLPVRAWVRFQCRYGCPDHGRWLTCPPHAPALDLTERMLSEFRTGLWVAAADHAGVNRILRELRGLAFRQGLWKTVALGAGHCDLCQSCRLDRCRHPEGAFPSLEACGVAVLEALERHGIDPRPGGRALCFGMLLVE